MRAFRDIGIAGSAGGSVVASGVAEALVTTAAGLFVAIVAVVAYNHLATWARGIVTNAELGAEELLSLIRPEH
jgi:biopolymer transport protein TolQ